MSDTLTPTKRILFVDASALRESACMLKFHNIVVSGYKAKHVSIDMLFGSAFHLFCKHYELSGRTDFKGSAKAASDLLEHTPHTAKAKKNWMTPGYLRNLCFDYAEAHEHDEWVTVRVDMSIEQAKKFGITAPPGGDSKVIEVISTNTSTLVTPILTSVPLVELKFAIPYYADDYCEILLAGTIDSIVHNPSTGAYAIKDYKTSSNWMIEEYFRSYELSCQLMFYRYAVEMYAKLYQSSVFNTNILAGGKRTIGAFIDGIFLQAEDAKFAQSDIFFYKREQMNEFIQLLQFTVQCLAASVVPGTPSPLREGMINGACDGKYGKCSFFNVCSAPDEVSRQHYLAHEFKQETYNPLTFGEY